MVRGVTELSGLGEIRTMHSSKKRSIPRVQSSAYLDLYMLGKEKDRLEKEMFILEKRKTSIQKRLDEIAVEMKKLEEEEGIARSNTNPNSAERTYTLGNVVKKEWKKMVLNY
ncbi:MAG: hypothetical protein Q7J55_04990 [bacterium]|nr:hypothetical protein [bacterium]